MFHTSNTNHINDNPLAEKCEEYNQNAHVIDKEGIAFNGSAPKGLYPHWMIKDGPIPVYCHVDPSNTEYTFKSYCSSLSGLSDIEKINKVGLLVAQLVHLPKNEKGIPGYSYDNITHSKDDKHSPLYRYRLYQQYSGLGITSPPHETLIMPTTDNLRYRFADCRTTNALFCWGLHVAGVKNVKWTYTDVHLYTGVNTDHLDGEGGDHAILLWKPAFSNQTTYVLDAYDIHFHGLPLDQLLSKQGIVFSSPYHEHKKNYMVKQNNYDPVQVKKSHEVRKAANASFFPRVMSSRRVPGLNCYHSSEQTEIFNSQSDFYAVRIVSQCSHPKVLNMKPKL